MKIKTFMIAGLSLIGAGSSPSAASAPPVSATALVSEGHGLEGDWEAPFGEGSLRFRFHFEGGAWRGWFVSKRDGSLYPLNDVEITDAAVTFRHMSRPVLLFSLERGSDRNTLTGIITLPDGSALPQTLRRM